MGITTLADGTRYETDVQKRGLYQYLDPIGDGFGTPSVLGTYAATPQEFFIQPGPSEVFQITRIIILIVDSLAFNSGKYGNNVVLTNGITLKEYDDSGLITDLTAGIPVKTNGDWAGKCHDFTEHGFGAGDVYGSIRLTFGKAGTNVRLVGALTGRLVLGVNDAFDDPVAHRYIVPGVSESTLA